MLTQEQIVELSAQLDKIFEDEALEACPLEECKIQPRYMKHAQTFIENGEIEAAAEKLVSQIEELSGNAPFVMSFPMSAMPQPGQEIHAETTEKGLNYRLMSTQVPEKYILEVLWIPKINKRLGVTNEAKPVV
jgi:hypothetical protein